MLDVKRLRILREVVNQGSFSGAADALYLSQSAVSQQIATLEREVGMTLLERTRDGTKPTDAGRVLVEHADAAICRLEEAESELQAIAGLEGGEVRSRAFPARAPPCLRSASPTSRGGTRRCGSPSPTPSPRSSIPRLRAGELDVAITFDYPTVPEPEERDLEHTLLLTEAMYVALPDRPPARRPRTREDDGSGR